MARARASAPQVVERIVEQVVTSPCARSCPARRRRARSSSGWPTARASSPSASTTTAARARSSSGCPSRARPSPASWTPSPSRSATACSTACRCGRSSRRSPNMRFEPAGMTDDPDIRFATSLMDYLFRRLAVEYLSLDERAELGIFSVGERLQPTLPGVEETVDRDRPGHRRSSPTRRRSRRRRELAAQIERPAPADADATDPAGPRHPSAVRRRTDVHAVRRPDGARRQLPRLPQLRHHQRLQLTRVSVVTNWGSTPAERLGVYSCDELIDSSPDLVVFRAVDIAAPASLVFRWLCQLRGDRAIQLRLGRQSRPAQPSPAHRRDRATRSRPALHAHLPPDVVRRRPLDHA